MSPIDVETRPARALLPLVALSAAMLLAGGCGKDDKKDVARPPLEVTALTVVARDVPVTAVYVAQTQSSQAVNIQARVSGFLDKRVYTEGAVVKTGQVLFQMDQKPFQAQVDASGRGAAAQPGGARGRDGRTSSAPSRSREQNALSQKDLDDAQGQYEQAQAAVAAGARRSSRTAKLNLSYTTIRVAGRRRVAATRLVADGTYLSPHERAAHDGLGADADVDQLQHLRERDGAHPQRGAQRASSSCPKAASSSSRSRWSTATSSRTRAQITFADPSYNPHDGHVPAARDGEQSGGRAAAQPVRARAAHGRDPAERDRGSAARRAAEREGPLRLGRERAEQGRAAAGRRSANGRAKAGSSREGLATGDKVVVDGGVAALRRARTSRQRPTRRPPRRPSPRPAAPPAYPAATPSGVHGPFRRGQSHARRRRAAQPMRVAPPHTVGIGTQIVITGYADKTGNAAANVELAKKRAQSVRDELVALGVEPTRIALKPPAGRDRQRQRRPGAPRRRSPMKPVGEADVLPLLHRAADLRGGRRDHHLPRRPRRRCTCCRSRSTRASRRCRSRCPPPIPAPTRRRSRSSVASPIEQQINGVDNMLYMSSIELAPASSR